MEQSDAVLLQALAMLIKAISEVPATFWGVIIGAGFSLSGVVLINKNNTTRLETQLANERIMKRAEREFNLKRDIYLECAEVVSIGLRSMTNFANLGIPNDKLMEDFIAKSGALAKIQIVGTPKTIDALNVFSVRFSEALVKLHELRTPLLTDLSVLKVKEKSMLDAQSDFDRVMESYKQFNFAGGISEQERQQHDRNTDLTLKRVGELRDEHTQRATELGLKSMSLYRESIKLHGEVSALLPALIEAVREEIELPIDADFMAKLQNEVKVQMIAMSERMEAIMKTENKQ